MNLGLHINKTPTGKFTFVGSVPYELAFVNEYGQTPDDSICEEINKSSNPAWVKEKYKIKTRIFDNLELITKAKEEYLNKNK